MSSHYIDNIHRLFIETRLMKTAMLRKNALFQKLALQVRDVLC